MSMSLVTQPLHIFRKDAIHLWPETLISIALLPAFAWAEVQNWVPPTQNMNLAMVAIKLAYVAIAFLLPVAWLILTSRLVHDEELVGDRQFWITRPYTWYSLLASKVLYLVVFICVPFLAMQMWLLHHAGMYPTHVLPAFFKNMIFIGGVFLLPLLVIAAVTATFVRYICSVLAGVIYLIVMLIIAGYNWSDNLSAPYIDHIFPVILLALLVAALLLQYAWRKTMIARILLLAVPIIIVLFAAFTPVNLLTSHRYPDVSAGTITFDSSAVRQQPAGRLQAFQHKNEIDIPVQVQVTGKPEDTVVEAQHVRATIDGPNGFHYVSDWSAERAAFAPGQSEYVLPVLLPEKVYDQIKDQPVAVHFELATQTLNAGTRYTVTATETPFPIPGNATCTVAADTGVLECRFPFANPQFMQVTATVHNGDCLNPGQLSAPAVGDLEPSLTSSHFSPVEFVRTNLTVGETKVKLCPGTPATFRSAVPGAYGRMHLDIPSITLAPYALRIPAKPAQQAPPPADNQ